MPFKLTPHPSHDPKEIALLRDSGGLADALRPDLAAARRARSVRLQALPLDEFVRQMLCDLERDMRSMGWLAGSETGSEEKRSEAESMPDEHGAHRKPE